MKRELTPGVLALIAVLSIGGLMFLGWQANLVGNVPLEYQACCTTDTWQNSPTGFTQGSAQTTTESCFAHENPKFCCARAVASYSKHPIRVLGARVGSCDRPNPDLSFPKQIIHRGTY